MIGIEGGFALQVALSKLVPFLRRDDKNQECSKAFCSHIFWVLLDVCELGLINAGSGKKQACLTWIESCQDVVQADVQNRVQKLLSKLL